jgi:IS30 family transposase
MSYTHLTIEERIVIYQLKKENKSMRYIAEAIGRSPSTVCRELKRNNCGKKYNYLPHIAHKKYIKRAIRYKRKADIEPMLVEYIEEKLKLTWSPEQIANRNNKEFKLPAFSTIYRWIHRGYILKGDMNRLRRKGKFKRPQETRGRFNIGKSIRKRPFEIYQRTTYGHWEADTVESGRLDHKRKSKYCFVTLAERKSRKYIARQIPNKSAEIVTEAIIELLSEYPAALVKSITCDRGKEFAGYKKIETVLECDVYFADPYCAWQKGTNENSNGLLREFYPKGMDLSKTNNNELKEKLDLINNRPRKCIGYFTSNEVMREQIIKCCT